MKKSQMEILGLAFVFVLIIFGFLIFVSLSPAEKDDPVKDYLEPKRASAITDVLLHLSLNCENYENYELLDMIKNCLENDYSSSRYVCEFKEDESYYPYSDIEYDFEGDLVTYDSCKTAEYYLNMSLYYTFERWGIPYYMEIYLPGDDEVDVLKEKFGNFTRYTPVELKDYINCGPEEDSWRARYQPIKLNYGEAKMNLRVCKY